MGRNADKRWRERAAVTPNELAEVREIEQSVRGMSHDVRTVRPRLCPECVAAAGVYAVDSTRKAMAFVRYRRGADGMLEYETHGAYQFPEELEQSEGELRAALWVARLEAARPICSTCRGPPLVIIGSDADGPRAAIRKGYSRSETFRRLLAGVFGQLTIRVEIVRIPSDDNSADAPSRDDSPLKFPERVQTSADILQLILRELERFAS